MSQIQFIIKTFLHYLKANLLVAIGVIISSAVLTGGLIIGDSITHSLEQITNYRLGKTNFTISAGDRFFSQSLATELESRTEYQVTPILISEAVVVADGGAKRANRVQVIGVENNFERLASTNIYSDLSGNEIIISENLAVRLSVNEGDNILLRIKKESLIPLNAPFVSDVENSVSFRATIKHIAGKNELGRFFLKNSQTAPLNVFMPMERLNKLLVFEEKANTLLITGENLSELQIELDLKQAWKPKDAGLLFRDVEKSGETEIISERVFLDYQVFDSFGKQPGAKPLLTYFVNGLSAKHGGNLSNAPYSFVSTLPENKVQPGEIIINQWLAADLNVGVTDSVWLTYFEIGPLRKLVEKSTGFVVKEVVSMDSPYADESLMPYLPGLSDAGDCAEWEAGVPIDLDKIRDKDEDYWDAYKGTPKAFISIKKAEELWSNRFGNYTAIRFDKGTLNNEGFKSLFSALMNPADLGFMVVSVKEKGMYAAQNGVDFSQLFIGLSFFLLIAAILLTSLLFMLNLENRLPQIGTLSVLGFKQKQIRRFFISEGLLISVIGSAVGLFVAVGYTKIVFYALNSLWSDIVRTTVLEIKIVPSTLIIGFIITVLISVIVITLAVRKKLKQQVADVQKKIVKKQKTWLIKLKVALGFLMFAASVVIIISQLFFKDTQNPSLFFMAGGLLLVSFLLFSDWFFSAKKSVDRKFSILGLSKRNTLRQRSRSIAIVMLFALATFLTISTGANKQDMFAGAHEKSSGTGGFLYFAETTMPLLFDINDPVRKAQETLPDNYRAVQFRKIDGDDASCLNLNRISNPAVLGVDAEELNGRFSFASKSDGFDELNPWLSLNKIFDDGTIPAIADQTVIQWGLGKKVGDVMEYKNEMGDTIRLKLVAGLAPSIFQGYIIIGNGHFLKNYPTSSGSNLFLIDGNPEDGAEINEALQFAFRDYGWEPVLTAQRLSEFYSVTNTYLSIFLALGALGLFLGTIGLAIVLARTIHDRKHELALLSVIGYPHKKLFNILVNEYFILLGAGVLSGLITAVLATLPSIMSTNTGVSLAYILILAAVILVNGIIWIVAISWYSIKNQQISVALKNE